MVDGHIENNVLMQKILLRF